MLLEVTGFVPPSLDLISTMCEGPKYMVWWQIADNNHGLLKCCETLVRIITHSSMLKADDVRLKSLPLSARFCAQCDHSALDDAKHLILQCPSLQEMRREMFDELNDIGDGSGRRMLEMPGDTLYLLLGRLVKGFTREQLVHFWSVTAKHVTRMYNSKVREGIG